MLYTQPMNINPIPHKYTLDTIVSGWKYTK